jgi:hypothetical protein
MGSDRDPSVQLRGVGRRRGGPGAAGLRLIWKVAPWYIPFLDGTYHAAMIGIYHVVYTIWYIPYGIYHDIYHMVYTMIYTMVYIIQK